MEKTLQTWQTAWVRWYANTIENESLVLLAVAPDEWEGVQTILRRAAHDVHAMSVELASRNPEVCPPGTMKCTDGSCRPMCIE
jgi:hypothetical protein